MHPVLHLLIVWDRDEQQELAPIARGDQALLVSRLVRVIRIFGEVQNLRPEQRLRAGVDGVEGRVRDTAGHGDSLDSSRARSSGKNACVTRIGPKTLIANPSITASAVSSSAPSRGAAGPALLIMQSTCPYSLRTPAA